jgi:hypothetical protein
MTRAGRGTALTTEEAPHMKRETGKGKERETGGRETKWTRDTGMRRTLELTGRSERRTTLADSGIRHLTLTRTHHLTTEAVVNKDNRERKRPSDCHRVASTVTILGIVEHMLVLLLNN